MSNVWQRIKDVLLIVFGLILLVVLLPIGAGGHLAGAIKRLLGNRGRTDETGEHLGRAGELAGDAGGAVESGKDGIDRGEERIDESLAINQRSQSLTKEGRKLLAEIRERGRAKNNR